MSRGSPRNGFSLVELSIVLVILGLLTGGILAGQSLIRAAELRAVTTEYQRWVTATQTFRDKYLALPGDMPNATRFWGKDNTYCPGDTGATAVPGTCNGNGDGRIWTPNSGNATGETFQFWKQLALAGLIEGNYSGISEAGATIASSSANVPTSRLPQGLWQVLDFGNPSGLAYLFDGTYNNCFQVGGYLAANSPSASIFKPEEVWNIDTKLDDGKPATGKVVARVLISNTLSACTTAAGSQAAQAASLDADYLVTGTAFTCLPVFRNQF